MKVYAYENYAIKKLLSLFSITIIIKIQHKLTAWHKISRDKLLN